MGIQSQEITNIFTVIDDSSKNLKQIALNEYNFENYAVKECCNNPDKEWNFLVKTFLDPEVKGMGEYVEKKLNGKLDNEYRRLKILNCLKSIEFEWECLDMSDDVGECCNWKAIEW